MKVWKGYSKFILSHRTNSKTVSLDNYNLPESNILSCRQIFYSTMMSKREALIKCHFKQTFFVTAWQSKAKLSFMVNTNQNIKRLVYCRYTKYGVLTFRATALCQRKVNKKLNLCKRNNYLTENKPIRCQNQWQIYEM